MLSYVHLCCLAQRDKNNGKLTLTNILKERNIKVETYAKVYYADIQNERYRHIDR